MVNRQAPNRRNKRPDVPAGFARRQIKSHREPDRQSAIEVAWRHNWTLLIGLFSVAFIAVRLLAAATGDPETAYAILQATGSGSVVVGSLIPAVGLLVFPLAVIGFSYNLSRKAFHDRSQALLMLATFALSLVVTTLTAPAIPLVLSIGTTLASVIFTATTPFSTLRQRMHNSKDLWPSPYALISVYAATAIVFTAVSSTMWLPTQNIITKERPGFSAYVLSQNDQNTWILTQYPTSVVQVPTKEIITMQICKTPDYRSQEETITELLGNSRNSGAFYPRCDRNYFDTK